MLHEAGILVTSITGDGATSNIKMAERFGCEFHDAMEMKTYFSHSEHGKVHFILDPCHMLKLVRNQLENKKSLINGNGEVVSWEYILKLWQLQEKIGLKLGNKLTQKHIFFRNQIMKVKLAAQVLSGSVANALQYCLDNKIKGFEDCKATIEFLNIFNTLFDILNSRSMSATGWKQALHQKNIKEVREFFGHAKKYILGLRTLTGTPIYMTNCKTGFIGFVVCMSSSMSMYEDLVEKHKYLRYLAIYKSNQDHLER